MNVAKTVAVAGLLVGILASASAQTAGPESGVATPMPTAPKLTATIFVSNGNSVTAYAPGSNGNVAPIASISDRSNLFSSPWGIAVDSKGNIYVASYDSGGRGAISVYRAGSNSNGDAVPTATIAGRRTGLDNPFGIALDSSGKIYVANFIGGRGTGSVTVYPADSNGNVAPIATIIGADTGLDNPSGIAVDSSGKIYVANRGGGRTSESSITVYAAGSNGNVKPIATIAGSDTGLDDPCIAVDSSGKIYAGNASDSITVYPAGSNGNVKPIATIAGPDTGDQTGLFQPNGIAVDSKGNIYAANSTDGTSSSPDSQGFKVTVYRAGSNGNIRPIAAIGDSAMGAAGVAVDSGGKVYVTVQFGEDRVMVFSPLGKGEVKNIANIFTTGQTWLHEAHGIALDRSGKIYVANSTNGVAGSIMVFPAGSTGNVAPIATIGGSDTGLDNPSGVALDSSGKIYVTNSAKTLVTKENRLASGPSSIMSYAAASNGNAKPIATITGVIKSYVPRGFTGWTDSWSNRYSPQDVLASEWQDTVDYTERLAIHDPAQQLARMRQQMGTWQPRMQAQLDKMKQAKPGTAPVPGSKLWVWNQEGPSGGTPGVSMYLIGSDGNVTRRVDSGSRCLLDFSEGLAMDSTGDLYMPPSECFGGNVEKVTVTPASSTDKKPTITITGSAGSPHGIAVDTSGNIYVTNSAFAVNSITVYPGGGSGKVTPIANIAGRSTLLDGPRAIALDSSGKIYVANSGGSFGNGSATVYRAGSNGDVKPIATISGSNTSLNRPSYPSGIAVDSDGNIYVTTEQGGPERRGSVNIYSAGSNGDVAPIATISGTLTGLNRPEGIALGPPIDSP